MKIFGKRFKIIAKVNYKLGEKKLQNYVFPLSYYL